MLDLSPHCLIIISDGVEIAGRVRGHPSRTSGLPGGGGVSGNRTSIVIFVGILLFNPDTRGRGGLKIPIFAGRP